MSSRASYKRSWEHFVSVCTMLSIAYLPASVNTCLVYIAHCSQRGMCYSTVVTRLSAIAFVHRSKQLPDNTVHFLVRKSLLGYKKIHSSLDSRRPITYELLGTIHQYAAAVISDPYSLALFRSMFTLAFFAFLRIGEYTCTRTSNVNVLQLKNIVFDNAHHAGFTVIFHKFKHSKGHPFRLHISSQNSTICPVRALINYLNLRSSIDGPLFMYKDNVPVSASHFQRVLKSIVVCAGVSPQGLTAHSFRIGASIHCLQDKKLSKAEIAMMGRWSSNALDSYLRVPSFNV